MIAPPKVIAASKKVRDDVQRQWRYKVLGPKGQQIYGSGRWRWALPQNGKPGRWMVPSSRGLLRMCGVGLHLTDAGHVGSWTGAIHSAWRLFVAEVHPNATVVMDRNKICVSKARLVEEIPLPDEDWLRVARDTGRTRTLPNGDLDVAATLKAAKDSEFVWHAVLKAAAKRHAKAAEKAPKAKKKPAKPAKSRRR